MASFEYASSTWRASFSELGVRVFNVEEAVTTRERDAAMTRDSDYDILRYRTEEEARAVYGSGWWPRVSNTEMNERRRAGDQSQEYRSSGEVKGGQGGEEGKSKIRRLFQRK